MEKPDFSTLLSYGNESVMLDKLIAETEKEMQAVKDAEQRKEPPRTGHTHTPSAKFMADSPCRPAIEGNFTPNFMEVPLQMTKRYASR